MRWIIFGVVFALFAGCDRRPQGTPPPAAATAPISGSTLVIDGVSVGFPPAHLRAQAAEAGVSALLSSQDAAGSFSFDMTVNAEDPQDLTGAQWHFQAASAERSNSPDGILLDGGQRQLQPVDVTILFIDPQTAILDGRFLLFADPDAMTPQKTVTVSGKILFATDGHR